MIVAVSRGDGSSLLFHAFCDHGPHRGGCAVDQHDHGAVMRFKVCSMGKCILVLIIVNF